MKTLETSSSAILQWLGNATAVDMDRITSHAVVNGPWSTPIDWGTAEPVKRITYTDSINGKPIKVIAPLMSSLFWNGVSFRRTVYVDGKPRGWFHMWRFSSTRFLQGGIGWKLNGRLAVLFRIQTDASNDSNNNLGHADGYAWGPK